MSTITILVLIFSFIQFTAMAVTVRFAHWSEPSGIKIGRVSHKISQILFVTSSPIFVTYYIFGNINGSLPFIGIYTIIMSLHLWEMSKEKRTLAQVGKRKEALSEKSSSRINWALTTLSIGTLIIALNPIR